MARQSKPPDGKPLVIVESPAKARTIGKFLGGKYLIEASIGHIRDLPENKKQLPPSLQQEDWAYLGVDTHNDFQPYYVVPPDRKEQVRKLQKVIKSASELYLATDEDREGEAISWHLVEVLKPTIPVHRMVFHEITREAIQEAIRTPRQIDDALVRAQETRRILDRLYGYDVSNFLWRKMGGIARSAGRVQSVAVRMVVEREHERIRFRPATYWDLLAALATAAGGNFQAALVRLGEQRLATGKDFDANTGKLAARDARWLGEAEARSLVQRLSGAVFRVANVEENPYTSRPYAPFTTSTLQQEASRKLRFSAKRTMQVAQSLYQNGYITYMRTDSTVLSNEAIRAARSLVAELFGERFLPDQPRIYASKVKNAQEAHEAIRPAGTSFRRPEEIRGEVSDDEFRLYDLIWKRTMASQMTDAKMRSIVVTIEARCPTTGETAVFQANGKTIDFPGYLRAYVEGADDPNAELADRETVLPAMQTGDELKCLALEPKSHTTQPPPRYTEATLTKALEERGIGRPSTYATILDTIVERNYVFKRGNALVPTWTAMATVKLMEQHLAHLVDYEFTAKMEDELDAISRGETGHVTYLNGFYFGNDKDGLKHLVEHNLGAVDIREICRFVIGSPSRQEGVAGDTGHGDAAHNGDVSDKQRAATDDTIYVRVGKFGPFLEQGDRRASLPADMAPDEVTVPVALNLLNQAALAEKPLGICPHTHLPVFLKTGRFGPYVQLGTANDRKSKKDKPKMASLLKDMSPESVTLETALKLLSLPRTLGRHPETGEEVQAFNGRFGPYIKCGKETRSLPSTESPLEVTLDTALALLAQPKAARRGFGASRAPLKVLGTSPVTQAEVKVMEGRYGKYVTDGTTNATLPKETTVEELTLDAALALLAERAARGPSTGRGRRGKTATSTRPARAAGGNSSAKGSKRAAAAKNKAVAVSPAGARRSKR